MDNTTEFVRFNNFLQNVLVEGKISNDEYQIILNKYVDGNDLNGLLTEKNLTNSYQTYQLLQYQEAQNHAYNLSLAADIRKRMNMYKEEITKLQTKFQTAMEDYDAKKVHWNKYRNGDDDPGNPRLKQKVDEAQQVIDDINIEISNWEQQYNDDNEQVIELEKKLNL